MSDLMNPLDVMPYAEVQRRARKITVGEAEDTLNAFARSMLDRYGPLAVEMRTLAFRLSQIERSHKPPGGDLE